MKNFYVIFRYLFLLFLTTFLGVILLQIWSLIDPSIIEIFKSEINLSQKYTTQVQFLLIVLVAPIFEELAFRGNLKFSNRNSMIIYSIFFILYFMILFLGGLSRIWSFQNLSLIIIISALTYFLTKRTAYKIQIFITKNKTYLFISSSILFGFVHLFNFPIIYFKASNLVNLIVLAIPFFLGGLVLGRVRLKYGILYSVSIHILYNSVIAIIHVITTGSIDTL